LETFFLYVRSNLASGMIPPPSPVIPISEVTKQSHSSPADWRIGILGFVFTSMVASNRTRR